MPKKKDEFDEYADEYGDEALEELLDLLGEFPELDEYLLDVADYDDEDFYTTGGE